MHSGQKNKQTQTQEGRWKISSLLGFKVNGILDLENLRTYYHARNKIVPAVDGVSFSLRKGEILGIVGESGCGKSTVARSLIRLVDQSYTEIVSGSALFEDKDLLKLSNKEMNKIRGNKISMIFQNPLTSLSPVYTIEKQIDEILKIHTALDKNQRHERCIELMKQVGIPAPEERLKDYPHQLSGGMQQRAMIAIALACNPDIIIADEPTTALDVTIQAQILKLIKDINTEYGLSMILITHNMGIVAQICSRVLVMYGGVVVEEGPTEEIFESPRHPYTKGLLKCIPSIECNTEKLHTIDGYVPKFSLPVTCCRFYDRCGSKCDKCKEREPELIAISNNRKIRCILESDK